MKIEHRHADWLQWNFGGSTITQVITHCPHECSDKECPGNHNRQRLELFDRYKKALEGLTPGGSEFVDDPERCAKHVSDRLESLRSGISMWFRRAKTNEAKAALFDEMLAALQMTLEWIDAVPSKTPLPSMPGFDRDVIDELITKAKELK